MKLYYSPGACSQAAHIVIHEAGLEHTSEAVDLKAKRTASGEDFWGINPKGAVPALMLPGGDVITENVAVMIYLGDQAKNEQLLPASGLYRYRIIEWLSYLGSDVHKAFSPLFNPAASADVRTASLDLVHKRLDYLERRLDGHDFLHGDTMSVADPYLFAMLGWTGHLGIDLANWPNLTAYRARIMARPTVQVVMKAEGLI